jgi:hypothetical protein
MLDKPTKDMEPAPGWRFLRFLSFGDNGDKAVEPKAKKPPKEPEERKHQFATWYIFAAFLGVMLYDSLVRRSRNLRARVQPPSSVSRLACGPSASPSSE